MRFQLGAVRLFDHAVDVKRTENRDGATISDNDDAVASWSYERVIYRRN